MNVPVVSVAPSANFVGLGQRKPPTAVEWSAESLVPEEIAAVTYLPAAFVDDAGYPVWQSARTEIAKAIGRRLDEAVLFGGGPASYPPNGVVGTGVPVTAADASAAVSAGLGKVEASGLTPTGIASGPSILQSIRDQTVAFMILPTDAATPSMWGLPIAVSSDWNPATCDAVVGDWTKLLIGIRQDISFDLSDSGTLFNIDGTLLVSAFQDDVVLLRVYLRVAVAVGVPVKPDGTPADAFVPVQWTTVAAAAATKAAKA